MISARRWGTSLEGKHAILVYFFLKAPLPDRLGHDIHLLSERCLKRFAEFFQPCGIVKPSWHPRMIKPDRDTSCCLSISMIASLSIPEI